MLRRTDMARAMKRTEASITGGLAFSQPDSALRRVPILRRCTLRGPGVDGPGVVCNLSVKGTYVAIKPVPKVGEQVVVALELPWLAEPMTMDAVVCWDNSDSKVHGLPPGCGVEFLATTREDQERIEAVVRAFAPHG